MSHWLLPRNMHKNYHFDSSVLNRSTFLLRKTSPGDSSQPDGDSLEDIFVWWSMVALISSSCYLWMCHYKFNTSDWIFISSQILSVMMNLNESTFLIGNFFVLTVKLLDAINVFLMKPEAFGVWRHIYWVHQSPPNTGMSKTQGMPKLMSSNQKKICS